MNLAYYQNNQDAIDLMWYLWCGKNSPLFGKSKLALFEKYFIQESKLINEIKDSYYKWIEQEQTCKMILKCFNLDSNTGHIINGHMPVKTVAGENQLRLMVDYMSSMVAFLNHIILKQVPLDIH
ncbi:fructose-bisphosphatase class III [Coprobacillaceae bacterium CR2/5/TPMF4]|nr:fructose-bisphosphatase class III [Coprobacillaceae bacterium CR2/5/TPMF4]